METRVVRILVVDDEEMKRLSLGRDLQAWGHTVTACVDGLHAWEALQRSLFDVVIADLMMPGMSGLDLLKKVKSGINAGCDVVMITAYGSIPVAVEAMKVGAFDFITKPFPNDQILPILQRIEQLHSEHGHKGPPSSEEALTEVESILVGCSATMRRIHELVEICSRSDSNVLLTGETGTGKDLAASVIHKRSARHAHPFVKVCCATFPSELFASELYGHERGAFTGADRAHTGRFDLAMHGTIYFDDVDDIPLEEQVKLLRVIEERVYERVGSNIPIQADVRIIASTKKDLAVKIAEGSFREDLYYRLNVMRIDLPPLRDRIEDVPPLVSFIMRKISGSERGGIDAESLGILASYHWPGNVRELRNLLERAYLTAKGVVTADLLSSQIGLCNGRAGADTGFKQRVDRFERELLLGALKAAGGNKTAAARMLGMKPSTFRDKLERLGL
jgi:DNA-binding NtrC family response regulator